MMPLEFMPHWSDDFKSDCVQFVGLCFLSKTKAIKCVKCLANETLGHE